MTRKDTRSGLCTPITTNVLLHAEREAIALGRRRVHLHCGRHEAAGGLLRHAVENVRRVLHLAPGKVHAVVRQERQKGRGGPILDVGDAPGNDALEVEVAPLVVGRELEVGARNAAHRISIHALRRRAKVRLEKVGGSRPRVDAGDVAVLGCHVCGKHRPPGAGVGCEGVIRHCRGRVLGVKNGPIYRHTGLFAFVSHAHPHIKLPPIQGKHARMDEGGKSVPKFEEIIEEAERLLEKGENSSWSRGNGDAGY